MNKRLNFFDKRLLQTDLALLKMLRHPTGLCGVVHYTIITITSILIVLTFFSFITLDFLSLSLIVLSGFLINICLLLNRTALISFKNYLLNFHYFIFLFIFLILFLAFTVENVFLFFICFEAILVPLVLLIGFFGSRIGAKIRSVYKLYLFTFIGGLPWLFVLVYLFNFFGTLNYSFLRECVVFEIGEEVLYFFAFFLAFAVKLPIVPLHLWLAEAHVEASTSGSVILAGVISKLGLYAFTRFLFPSFPVANTLFAPVVLAWGIFSVFSSSLQAIRQIDLKRIIAYSSVAHMSFFPVGLYSMNSLGFLGAILGLFSHAFIASGLSMLAGFLYDRFKTRNLFYFSGLLSLMPISSFFAILFCLANLPFPGFFSFITEILILIGIMTESFLLSFLLILMSILTSIYTLRFLLIVFFGKLTKDFRAVSEINSLEFFLLSILLIPTIYLGGFSKCFPNKLCIIY